VEGISKDIVAMAYVYILQSMKSCRYYIGSTKDIKTRLRTHKSGGVQATKNLLPLKLMLQQEYADFGHARQVERKLKKFKRRDYIEKIIKDGKIKITGD